MARVLIRPPKLQPPPPPPPAVELASGMGGSAGGSRDAVDLGESGIEVGESSEKTDLMKSIERVLVERGRSECSC